MNESKKNNHVFSLQIKRSTFIIIFFLTYFHFLVINCFTQDLPYTLDPDRNLSQYTLGNYTNEHGLPSKILNHILKAKDGYIWITTYRGLVRFDGTKVTVFNSQNTGVFETNGLSVIKEDKDGRFLIGSHGRGVYTYKNGVFGKLGSKKFDKVIESILIDKTGKIWIGTRNSGLYIFKEGLYKKMFVGSDKIKSRVMTMLQKIDGTIYFGTAKDGVFFLKNGSLFPIFENNKLKGKIILSFAYDYTGSLWIGAGNSMYRLKGEQISLIDTFNGLYITKIISNKFNIWVSTTSGLFRKSADQEWQYLTDRSKQAKFSDFVRDIEGNMWLASKNEGLFYLKDSRITSFSASDGIEGGVNAILELENNSFLIGTLTGHLYTINSTDVKPFKTKTLLSKSFSMHIFKDRKDNILISTIKGTLKIAPDKSETWLTKDMGFNKLYVRVAFEDSRENLWFGTDKRGLIKLLPDKSIVIFDNSNGLKGNLILSVSEDKDGNILAGSAGGGLSLITKEDKIKNFSTKNGLPSNIIFYTYKDNTGTTWIGSANGLIRFKDKTFFTFSKNNGFPVNQVFRILEDNKGDLWMISNTEIVRVSRNLLDEFADGKIKNLKYQIYNKHSGMKQFEFSTISWILKANDGSLWFTSTNILIKIESEKLIFNKKKPPVYIENMRADNDRLNIKNKIVLMPETKRITFDYTALHYFAPAKIRFKYRLEGFEKEWTEVGNIRRVSYTNLSYGNYTFRVIACNNDGIWNEEGDRLSFSVKPFWYETFLFKLLIVFLIFGVIILIIKIWIKQLVKRKVELEQIVKKRTADIEMQKEEIQTQAEKLKDSFKEINEKNSELKASYEKMERIAKMDPLTRLSNRRDFLEKIGYVKAISDRKGKTFVLVIGDIDHFKDFNDKYGHDCGDFVLLSVANLFKEVIRKQDYVGRWGGEEFVFLFPETNLEGGQIITEKIRREIAARTYSYKGLILKITMTFGICEYNKPEDIDLKLKQADEALYKGKKAGRNCVVLF